jgi:hypothetical protein
MRQRRFIRAFLAAAAIAAALTGMSAARAHDDAPSIGTPPQAVAIGTPVVIEWGLGTPVEIDWVVEALKLGSSAVIECGLGTPVEIDGGFVVRLMNDRELAELRPFLDDAEDRGLITRTVYFILTDDEGNIICSSDKLPADADELIELLRH